MSHNVLAFIIVWIVAVSFGIEYFNTAKNKFIIFLLVLFSLHSFVYGIYIFSSWGNYVSQRSSDWLIENPNADSVPTVFLIIPIYPYLLIFFGLFGLIFYSSKLKKMLH
tara:strand:+ start:501 stop:827 length:327 start_codon:yes stop_codon:yes gene_type:complete